MTARIGAPKTGGRRKGSLDKNARQLVTGDMAADLLTVYRKLGGVKWLLKFAEDNPAEFLRQGLSRLFPAPQKDDPDFMQQNNQFNFNQDDPVEVARRVAFALSVGIRAQAKQQAALIEADPEPIFDPKAWVPPIDAPDMPDPGQRPEALDADRQRWAEEIHLTPEQRAAKALVRETVEADITNYRGSLAEQPGGSVPRPPARELSPGERRRAVMSRRGRDLL